MSRPRRPSVSIHDYPEDLNPFKDGVSPTIQQQTNTVELRQTKEPKNKFWTFGRSKKKRSNSFSVKSAWNGLFGKRKELPEPERRTTITTVSTSYQNGQFSRPVPPPRSTRDQQEFEEAFGTFTRRKKYTMESSSTYGSNLTVNGDPARLYNGSPQETTASILGELTPKPPARRFGQVSPRPRDELPPLEFEVKDDDQRSPSAESNGVIPEDHPVPTRRQGRRSIPRVNVLEAPEEEERGIALDVSLRDENENLADDFVFRRCSQDAVRRSNLSINSCVSTASGMSTSGRRKRRAPQPPQRKESPESSGEEKAPARVSETELQITEPIDIAKVTEDIQLLTKESQNIEETINSSSPRDGNEANALKTDVEGSSENAEVQLHAERSPEVREESVEDQVSTGPSNDRIEVENVEINRVVEETIEIITDVNANSPSDDLNGVEVRKKTGGGLSRSDSFSVKEQIEQIERQIKELEARNLNNNNNNNSTNNNTSSSNNNNNGVTTAEESKYYEPSEARLSIQANRRSFFKNMVSNVPNGVRIQVKELPREQKDIQVIKLSDPPVPVVAPKEPVKIVALHISEPIKQVPELVDDLNVNPLPKPRRHSSIPGRSTLNGDREVSNGSNQTRVTRGDSL